MVKKRRNRGVKKGARMVCVPCGRQVTVSAAGISRTTLWCCGRPMKTGNKAHTGRVKRALLGKKGKKGRK